MASSHSSNTLRRTFMPLSLIPRMTPSCTSLFAAFLPMPNAFATSVTLSNRSGGRTLSPPDPTILPTRKIAFAIVASQRSSSMLFLRSI